MYDFHYNFIKKNFDAELLFTDTHSLSYEIKPENIYEELFKWKDLFDFSNYPKDALDDRICMLTYFHKSSVTSCKEIKNDCDNWKILWLNRL